MNDTGDRHKEETVLVRRAEAADLDRAEQMLKAACAYLKEQGSPQWQNGYGPGRGSLERNLARREGFVLLLDGVLCGYASLVEGADAAYAGITDGHWAGVGDRYIAIHSVALDPSARGRGLASRFLCALTETARGMGYRDVRIDTHACNTIMQRAIARAGFAYRGMVHFPIPNGERMAYQRLLE